VIVADTSGLLAYFNRREPAHARVRACIDGDDTVIVSPFIIAELDYLVATRLGIDAALTALRELSGGGYVVASFDHHDLAAAADVMERYRDLDLGIADASLLVLADRFGTSRVLTLDHRHFGAVTGLDGNPVTILPA
jgi:predicted nucleic acid-binding protein